MKNVAGFLYYLELRRTRLANGASEARAISLPLRSKSVDMVGAIAMRIIDNWACPNAMNELAYACAKTNVFSEIISASIALARTGFAVDNWAKRRAATKGACWVNVSAWPKAVVLRDVVFRMSILCLLLVPQSQES